MAWLKYKPQKYKSKDQQRIENYGLVRGYHLEIQNYQNIKCKMQKYKIKNQQWIKNSGLV